MAFATANLRSGTFGQLKMLAGDWSGAVGDAAGTVTLSGGRCYSARFQNHDNDAGKLTESPTRISESAGTITVTVTNIEAVTDGRFVIIYA